MRQIGTATPTPVLLPMPGGAGDNTLTNHGPASLLYRVVGPASGLLSAAVASGVLAAGRSVTFGPSVTSVAVAVVGSVAVYSIEAGVLSEIVPALSASGSITLAAQPADTNTITLNDGVNPAVIFEFDSSDPAAVTAGHIRVAIAATAALTLTNLVAAINAHAALNITAADISAGTVVAALANETPGTAGNIAAANVGGNITVAGMSGGSDAHIVLCEGTPFSKATSDTSAGNAVQVTAVSTPCQYALVRSPRITQNTVPCYITVAAAAPAHAVGILGTVIDIDDTQGVIVRCSNLNQLYVASTAVGAVIVKAVA